MIEKIDIEVQIIKGSKDASKGELLKIVKTLMHESENKSLLQA
jgi:hypothetical protein